VFFLLHHVLKACVSPNPHHEQPYVYIVTFFFFFFTSSFVLN
jgi:hypothetical protein